MSNHQKYKYKAFISYSHKDREMSEWLHKKLEGYQLPKSLLKERLNLGLDNGKLRPIFRDREELPAHENMTDKILEAIGLAEYLIVICSPNSTRSFMVNEEIREFRKLNGNKNILCLITSGDPGVFNSHSFQPLDAPDLLPASACFPPALFETNSEVDSLPNTASNPLAADVRMEGDGKKNAYLKIAAGMLGVNLGELVRRDFVKRQRQIISALFVSLSVTAMMGWLAWTATKEAERAELQQKKTEEFGEYFADLLADQLLRSGRSDHIDGIVERLRAYYDNVEVRSLDTLYSKALAYSRIAFILDRNDRKEDYAELQLKAIEIANELVEQDPDNTDYLYLKARTYSELATKITWQGQAEKAIEYIQYAKDILHRLLEKEPDNRNWLHHIGIAYTIAGLSYRNMGDIKAAAKEYRKALEYRKYSTTLKQPHAWVKNVLGAAYHNMGVVHSYSGSVRQMYDFMTLAEELYRKAYETDQMNTSNRFVLARSYRGLGQSLRFLGNVKEALTTYNIAYKKLKDLHQSQPDNAAWKFSLDFAAMVYAEMLISNGNINQAKFFLDKHSQSIHDFYVRKNAKNYYIAAYYYHKYSEALIANYNGNPDEAKRLLSIIIDKFDIDKEANLLTVPRISNAYTSAYLLYGQLLKQDGNIDGAHKSWRKAIDVFGNNLSSKRMDVRANLAQIYLELGKYEKASEIIVDLGVQGYREVSYVRAVDTAIADGMIERPDGWQSASGFIEFHGKGIKEALSPKG